MLALGATLVAVGRVEGLQERETQIPPGANVNTAAHMVGWVGTDAPTRDRLHLRRQRRKDPGAARPQVEAAAQKQEAVAHHFAFQTQAMFQTDQVLANMAAQKINQDTKVDDAALRKYYDDHKSEFEQIRARHILIRFKGSPVPVKPGAKDLSEEEALAKTQDLEKRLQGGADFGQLATAESDDVGSANMNGDLGTFGHGKMVPSFDEAAFKLKPGQISDPVKSQFGYHIIKVDGVENKSFEDAKAEIEKKLRPAEVNKAMEEIQKNTKVVYDPVFFGMQKQ